MSPGQQGQVGIISLQFFHPALPRLEHRFEAAEGTARRGGCDTEDRRQTVCVELLVAHRTPRLFLLVFRLVLSCLSGPQTI